MKRNALVFTLWTLQGLVAIAWLAYSFPGLLSLASLLPELDFGFHPAAIGVAGVPVSLA